MTVRRLAILLALLLALTWIGPWPAPIPSRAQGVDVFLNITAGGAKKLNIAVPDFTLVSGADPSGAAKTLAGVAAHDLTFSGFFSVVSGTAALPANDASAVRKAWADFAAAGAHAGLQGLLTVRPDRLEGEMRLYDLTAPEQKLIASRRFEVPAAQSRRLAHKIADEVVRQFTGEPGVADTKIAYVGGRVGAKEIWSADSDGFNEAPVTKNGSINLTPVWAPDTRSLAFVSYFRGYPDLYRAFPFERRPLQTLAAYPGLNSAPAWSPDGRMVALTLSKDGNPEIYVLTVATGKLQRLTRYAGIDTDPTWSPTGRQIAFDSERAGGSHVFVMDVDGTNVRQLTFGGRQTQPRWSPKGDTIVYTLRAGVHELWAINADGTNARRIAASRGDNQGASWAPDGRHVAFQSSRTGTWKIYAMLADGSEQTQISRGQGEHTSPSWSSRLP